MSKKLQKFTDQKMKVRKFFQYCLSKLKNPRPQIHPPPSFTRILSGCKQPKTHSIAIVRGNNAATLSDIDRFLFENFNSLFLHEEDTIPSSNNIANRVSGENQRDPRSGSMSFDSTLLDIVGDCSEASGSRESIVVLASSVSQYEDLRRSMKEMVDRRLRNHGRVDWGFMEELLFCYLNLNERKSYKFILNAYVDLINGLRETSPVRAPATAKPRSVRTFRTGREIKRKEKNEDTLQFVE
ncbi:transcription repressor OFP14-like [Prosopis cineraria]|uniref:transcription repressor OFP14-like n=1 Tax=Prosopis cineraria TaxID=364024 RepID=UPI0024102F86|nr:transcription repressor OFP14-like [Prosopis cineraria]